jgi:glycosyltransferase involved in cell wall biosynthesis
MPLFSVVIPTHNRAALLGRAIQSVQAQTCSDYELVVVDDGSSNATAELLRSLKGPRTTFLRHEVARGASAARNAGVLAATGEMITFLDDDDELRPNALQCLRDMRVACPQLDFLWGGRLIHEEDRDGETIDTREDDWHAVPCPISGSDFLPYVLQIATSAAFTIKRSLYQQLGGLDTSFKVSEDRDFFVTLAEGNFRGGAVDATIIDVHEISSSLSRSTGMRTAPDSDLRVLDKHRDYLQRPEHRQFEDGYLRAIFASFLQSGNRGAAMQILGTLRRRGALNLGVLRKYVRHAPEFRALKSLIRYNRLRQMTARMRHRAR